MRRMLWNRHNIQCGSSIFFSSPSCTCKCQRIFIYLHQMNWLQCFDDNESHQTDSCARVICSQFHFAWYSIFDGTIIHFFDVAPLFSPFVLYSTLFAHILFWWYKTRFQAKCVKRCFETIWCGPPQWLVSICTFCTVSIYVIVGVLRK